MQVISGTIHHNLEVHFTSVIFTKEKEEVLSGKHPILFCIDLSEAQVSYILANIYVVVTFLGMQFLQTMFILRIQASLIPCHFGPIMGLRASYFSHPPFCKM